MLSYENPSTNVSASPNDEVPRIQNADAQLAEKYNTVTNDNPADMGMKTNIGFTSGASNVDEFNCNEGKDSLPLSYFISINNFYHIQDIINYLFSLFRFIW